MDNFGRGYWVLSFVPGLSNIEVQRIGRWSSPCFAVISGHNYGTNVLLCKYPCPSIWFLGHSVQMDKAWDSIMLRSSGEIFVVFNGCKYSWKL